MTDTPQLTILMPCLNEAETIEICIRQARAYLQRARIPAEILIADNRSTDQSVRLAKVLGARVIHVDQTGYGETLKAGIRAARGQWIVMGDADASYDFSSLDAMLEKLHQGFDLVMGNRFQGGIAAGAMPFLHRHVGNPMISKMSRLLFQSPCGDTMCGLRGFKKTAILSLPLASSGMAFACEMLIKASAGGLRITEVPVTLAKDGRSRPPHLKTWRDGYAVMRLMLSYKLALLQQPDRRAYPAYTKTV